MASESAGLDRRHFIEIGAGLLSTWTRPAWGQEVLPLSLSRTDALSRMLQLALEARSFALGLNVEDFGESDLSFVQIEYHSTRETLLLAREVGLTSQTSIAALTSRQTPSDLSSYFIPSTDSMDAAAQLLNELRVPVVPFAEDVGPIGIISLEPRPDNIGPGQDEAANLDNDIRVIADLIADALGITFVDANLIVILTVIDPEAQKYIQELISGVTTRDWERVAQTAEAVVSHIIAIETFVKVAGNAAQRVAFRLGLRCVPLVGPVYMIAALVVSVIKNYDRFSFA